MPHYEINVAKDGHHLFATHERSLTSPKKTKEVYDKLVEAFPKNEGYAISISYWETVGQTIKPKKLSSDF
jgi:acid stress-induced BolA-like protein IbaG/YrbA